MAGKACSITRVSDNPHRMHSSPASGCGENDEEPFSGHRRGRPFEIAYRYVQPQSHVRSPIADGEALEASVERICVRMPAPRTPWVRESS